jgi:hypothetical protein
VDGEPLALSAKMRIAAIRRNSAVLLAQIKQSQETIARSQELLRRTEAILEKAGDKP